MLVGSPFPRHASTPFPASPRPARLDAPRGHVVPRPQPPQRPLLLIATVVLAALTAIALIRAAALIDPAPASARAVADPERVVVAFYDALNDAIRTGDPSFLDGLVSPALLNGLDSGGVGLRQRIRAARAVDPDLRLSLDDVIADGDRVATRVSSSSSPQSPGLGSPRATSGPPWGPLDILRVVDGRVVDFQPASPHPVVEPLAHVSNAPRPDGATLVGLARLAFSPAGHVPALEARGPILLLVEEGEVRVRLDRPAVLTPALGRGLSADVATVVSGDVGLRPGDALAIEPGTPYGLHNAPDAPARLLAAALLPASSVARTGNRTVPSPLDVLLFAPDFWRAPVTERSTVPWPVGVTSTPLVASSLFADPDPSLTLALGRVALPSGAILPVQPASGSQLLAIDAGAGQLRVLAGHPRHRADATGLLALLEGEPKGSPIEARIATGGAAVLLPGHIATVETAAPDALKLLLLTVTPSSSLSPPP